MQSLGQFKWFSPSSQIPFPQTVMHSPQSWGQEQGVSPDSQMLFPHSPITVSLVKTGDLEVSTFKRIAPAELVLNPPIQIKINDFFIAPNLYYETYNFQLRCSHNFLSKNYL